MVQRRDRQAAIEAFGDRAERAPVKSSMLPVRDATKGEPAWKRRNREPKHKGIVLRCSDSQIELLQMAKADQEISIQKILEKIVWPVMEDQYGVREEDAPS